MRTVTTKEQVALNQLRRMAEAMEQGANMPSPNIATYPTNDKTTQVLKKRIVSHNQKARDQCRVWAEELIKLIEVLDAKKKE